MQQPPKGYARIQAAMKEREKWVLQTIRREGRYNDSFTSLPIMRACDRLVAKGKIRYSRAQYGYVLKVKRGHK